MKTYKVQKEFSKETENPGKESILKSTPYIVFDIFLERYVTAGVLVILPLFLHLKLGIDQNQATSIYHTYNSVMMLFTIVGTIVADTWCGLYSAVIITSVSYIFGLAMVTVAMIKPFSLPIEVLVPLGLVIMMISSGSLRNNMNAFGGGQHKLPEQKSQLEKYFSIQYFGHKCGSFLTRIISPTLRAEAKCFGEQDCYSLTFGIMGGIMLVGTAVFLLGSFQYKNIKPNGNMIVKVSKCIKTAVQQKSKSKSRDQHKQHWLDYAEAQHGKKLVMETKAAIKVILVSLPVPIFWSALMQQRSRWIFQGTKMNGDLGWYVLKPDQLVVINSLVAILFIPFLDKYIYPMLKKIGIKTMLHRLTFGGFLIVIAFILAVLVEVTVHQRFISILWQIPQYVFLAIAETIVYISHLNFAYKEAPTSMKPVMMSLLYLSMAGGDLIVVLMSTISIFPSQAYEYGFFVALIAVNVVGMTFISQRYKNVDHEALNALESEDKK